MKINKIENNKIVMINEKNLENYPNQPFSLYEGDKKNEDGEEQTGGRSHSHNRQQKSSVRIEDILKNNQMVMVQVTKNPIMHKGARLTQEVSLAGRFVVLIPNQPTTYGISKRLPDDERRRLRRILDAIRPDDAGLIVRTAAEGATDDELRRDMLRLVDQWNQIKELSERAAKSKKPTLLYREPDLVMRMIREEFNREYRAIVVDNKDLYKEILKYVEAIMPELVERVELYKDSKELDLFERYHVTEQLVKALDRKVWLPSGGSLIIERTEALTVIDVNTGKNVGTTNLEETVFQNNLEAAEEIARQLRLRDIGGIIVVDFIDMKLPENKRKLQEAMEEFMRADRARHAVLPISKFGIMQLTRQRMRPEVSINTAEICPGCNGTGKINSTLLLIDEIENKLNYLITHQHKNLSIHVHPIVHSHLTKGFFTIRWKWSRKYKIALKINPDTDYQITEFHFFDGNDEEIRF